MKLVHLFGFIVKKFVTMHGHMNVKCPNEPLGFIKYGEFRLADNRLGSQQDSAAWSKYVIFLLGLDKYRDK